MRRILVTTLLQVVVGVAVILAVMALAQSTAAQTTVIRGPRLLTTYSQHVDGLGAKATYLLDKEAGVCWLVLSDRRGTTMAPAPVEACWLGVGG